MKQNHKIDVKTARNGLFSFVLRLGWIRQIGTVPEQFSDWPSKASKSPYPSGVSMTFEEKVARAFRMDERARQRHCNPWSVYTRLTMIPLIGLALWSRVWLHWWALLPVALAFLWIWMNPRVFPRPVTTKSWASKAVLGEWVWMRRKRVAIPIHHRHLPNLLSLAAGLGMAVFLIGVALLHLWLTLLGGCISFLVKLWFADRMVWLYQEMKDATQEYQSWLY